MAGNIGVVPMTSHDMKDFWEAIQNEPGFILMGESDEPNALGPAIEVETESLVDRTWAGLVQEPGLTRCEVPDEADPLIEGEFILGAVSSLCVCTQCQQTHEYTASSPGDQLPCIIRGECPFMVTQAEIEDEDL